jgi:tetraacyldisaccharide 4'-kinase
MAAAGLAAPEKFFGMLEARGLTIRRLPLADHASFEPRPWASKPGLVLVTEKDAVKLPADADDASAIHVVTLDFELPAAALVSLRALLPPPTAARTKKPP